MLLVIFFNPYTDINALFLPVFFSVSSTQRNKLLTSVFEFGFCWCSALTSPVDGTTLSSLLQGFLYWCFFCNCQVVNYPFPLGHSIHMALKCMKLQVLKKDSQVLYFV